jgi:alkanesulfonate monooxygenase SsuD/methylene tetrahydromethanopterin reductase-like flavin-dependent oxidoreductase (luciferase family)
LREETQLMGGDFDHRWSQARDSISALKELWTKDEAEYHGRYYDFPPVKVYPKPVQKPHPPIMLGGMAPNVLKRVVNWADGWMPNRVSAARIEEARREIEALAGEVGRDPASINISVFGQPADTSLVRGFLDAGADRVIISPPTHTTDEAMGEELERTANLLLR